MSTVGDRRIFFINEEILKENDTNQKIIGLKNPTTENYNMYVVANNKIFELNTFNEDKRHWIIDDSTVAHGKIYILNKIDLLFLIIPYLEKFCSDRAQQIPELIQENLKYMESFDIFKYLDESQLLLVADSKGSKDLHAYLYNEEKTLNWLKRKCEILDKMIKMKSLSTSNNSWSSASYYKSSKVEADTDNNDSMYTSYGIVSDYLSPTLKEKLGKLLNVLDDTKQNKRKSTNQHDEPSKRIKRQENSDLNISVTEEKKPLKKDLAKEKLAKAAKGSKSISSFFTKK